MPDDTTPTTETTQTPEQTAETPPAGTETPPETETPKADEKPAEEEKAGEKISDLPAWAQKHITDLRGENANYRTRATTAEQKLADAKTPEQVEAAVAEIKAENSQLARDLMVTRVAAEFELPAELAELLKGDDEAALKVHAKTLAKYAGSSEPGELRGGLTPNEGDEFDPVKVAQNARQRRY